MYVYIAYHLLLVLFRYFRACSCLWHTLGNLIPSFNPLISHPMCKYIVVERESHESSTELRSSYALSSSVSNQVIHDFSLLFLCWWSTDDHTSNIDTRKTHVHGKRTSVRVDRCWYMWFFLFFLSLEIHLGFSDTTHYRFSWFFRTNFFLVFFLSQSGISWSSNWSHPITLLDYSIEGKPS